MLLTILLLAYLAALLWFGLYGNTRDATLRTLLTTGGTTGTILCALSLVSTIIGGSATLGVGTLAQKIGPAAVWWFIVGATGLFLHGLLVAPVIRLSGALTLPHLLGELAGRGAEKWAGLIIAVSWIAVTAAQFSALHALLGSVTPGVRGEALYVLLSGAIVLHTAMGGQRGVIRTDAVQAVLLIGGFAAAALWCAGTLPDAVASLPMTPWSDAFGWDGVAKLALLVGVTYVIGPDMFSRSFAARDASAARRAALTASPILLVFGVIITLLALLNLEARKPVADWLSEGSPMPALLTAALTIALVSALSGSADTVLLSAAGIIEKDLCGRERVLAVRLWTAGFGLLAAGSVWFSGDIIHWLLTGYSFFVPGVAAPMLALVLGRLRRADPVIWLTASIIGGLGGLAGSLTGGDAWTYAGMAVSFLGSLAAVQRAKSAA